METGFWKCPTAELQTDPLLIITNVVTCFSLVLNIALLVIISLLRGTAKIFLVHLRALTVSVIFYNFIELCNLTISPHLFPTDSFLAPTLCHAWRSDYLTNSFYYFGALILNVIVSNRAVQLACKYPYAFSNSLAADLAYVVGMGLISIIVMLPQALLVHWNGKRCLCLDTHLPYIVVVSLYAETFVRFGLAVLLSGISLSISCYKIINWVRSTPAEQLVDNWNSLAFHHTTQDQIEEFSRPQGWMTASMCIIPLSVNYLAVSILRIGYEFTCAVGFCKIMPQSLLARLIDLLIHLQMLALPIIISVYIPSVQHLLLTFCRRLTSICRKPITREDLDSRTS
ncbi:unnamed protein product [Dibothriocephalus latus]|uniref:G-protein coupled receptors family 1 profile domain-containing protein n=1 Tax=Dibothriocephalus latus TaxID=60516 RepID=A0A3P6PQ89_DIBLA|nr:unnamed protein product [Dibothriocephalus latus]